MFALTQLPSPRLAEGQRTHLDRVPIDMDRALCQHAGYCDVLRACGARVETLMVNVDEPDGVFIEDTAVVLDELAVLGSMGTAARLREPTRIEPVLQRYRMVRHLDPSATLEGGDVLRVGRTLFVGLSCRTNRAGILALARLVVPHGYTVRPVAVTGCLHLKTACTALPDGRLLINPAWLALHDLAGIALLPVPAEEPWAANTLPVGDTVLMPAGYPRTAELLAGQGFTVRPVDLSEFGKAEGSVTCLSLWIDAPCVTGPVRLAFPGSV